SSRTIVRYFDQVRPKAAQNVLRGFKPRQSIGTYLRVESQRMCCTKVTLDGGNVISEFASMRGGVSIVPMSAVFLIHPGNHPNCPLGLKMQPLNQFRGFHRYGDSGRIIDSARSEI